MRFADLISGLILVLFGLILAVWVIPAEAFPGDPDEMAPAFLPTVAAVVIVALAGVQTVVAGVGREPPPPDFDRFSVVFLIASAAVFGLVIALIMNFGFIVGGISSITLIGFIMRPKGSERWWLLAIAVALPLGSYMLAWHGLRLSLP
ncbi:MAG: tripartite tricarboxylate transporter TctB family protein [Alphaproteobacteria bacterium]|jgi:hypothetical protein|nr:tripartite tricarboxylate transporter TctB family protein [Alphaproteobacteria bacterium]